MRRWRRLLSPSHFVSPANFPYKSPDGRFPIHHHRLHNNLNFEGQSFPLYQTHTHRHLVESSCSCNFPSARWSFAHCYGTALNEQLTIHSLTARDPSTVWSENSAALAATTPPQSIYPFAGRVPFNGGIAHTQDLTWPLTSSPSPPLRWLLQFLSTSSAPFLVCTLSTLHWLGTDGAVAAGAAETNSTSEEKRFPAFSTATTFANDCQ